MIVEPDKSFGFTGELGNIPEPHNDTEGICVPHHSLDICSVSSCSVIRSSGSSGGTVGNQSSTEVYIGNLYFLWPGFLTPLQICCVTSGRSL